ncbi:MAG: hypothetical protein O3C58_12235 [Nitrospinae bacterium]|nr:hypothetical protein [Nitrospinota bacterium]
MDESASHFIEKWFVSEKPFVLGLRHEDKEVRLKTLNRFCSKFGVVRNLKRLETEKTEGRLNPLLTILERYKKKYKEIDRSDTSKIVNKLSENIREDYGTLNISLSSKLLWMLFQSPIVIYDSKVKIALKSEGYKIKDGDYDQYLKSWNDLYEKHKPDIKKSCAWLVKSKPFEGILDSGELKELMTSDWFQLRVFDIYLWKL